MIVSIAIIDTWFRSATEFLVIQFQKVSDVKIFNYLVFFSFIMSFPLYDKCCYIILSADFKFTLCHYAIIILDRVNKLNQNTEVESSRTNQSSDFKKCGVPSHDSNIN